MMAGTACGRGKPELKLEVLNVGGPEYTQHHIKARDEDIARYCFIPGDHIRGRKIAERLEDVRQVSATRGMFVHTGYYGGVRMTVCSTGMGGPQVAIAMEELGRMGADTFIRVGSAGGLQDNIGVGDIAIATATYRDGGTSYKFLPGPFPAVADFFVTRTLYDVARELGARIHIGVVSAGDAFYAPPNPEFNKMLVDAGVICVEMESDTVFILGHYRRFRCGALFVMDGGPKTKVIKSAGKVSIPIANHATDEDFLRGEDMIISIALEAMKRIALEDQDRSAKAGD